MSVYPKCKICKHSRSKHSDVPHCFDCWSFLVYGPSYDWEYNIDATKVSEFHAYNPDNLGFLEYKYEKATKLR